MFLAVCFLVTSAFFNSSLVYAGLITAENIIGNRSQSTAIIGVNNQNTITNGFLKQSFKTDAVIAGTLESISLDMARLTWTTEPLIVSLYTASDTLPNILPDTLLGSVTESLTSFPFGVGFPTTIDFLSQGIVLAPSTDYVITAEVANPNPDLLYEYQVAYFARLRLCSR